MKSEEILKHLKKDITDSIEKCNEETKHMHNRTAIDTNTGIVIGYETILKLIKIYEDFV